jgi:hypothetical protein
LSYRRQKSLATPLPGRETTSTAHVNSSADMYVIPLTCICLTGAHRENYALYFITLYRGI